MFSIQNWNRFNRRLLFPYLFFHKRGNAMICSNKCSFPMQMYKKAAALQEQQQFRMFRHSCLLQNSQNAASSMSTPLDVDETTATNKEFSTDEKEEVKAKLEQQLKETEKQAILTTEPKPIRNETVNIHKLISKRIYPSQTIQERFNIRYQMGKSGQKFIVFEKGYESTISRYPNIHIPEDVFAFVQAMDELLEAVDAKKKSIIEALTNRKRRLILHTAKAKGTIFDFQLELCVFNNFVQVQMRSVPNEHKPGHISKYMFLPLHQFYWLRNAIGELFAANGEDDVQRRLGKPLTSYPSWLRNKDNSTRNSLPNNRHNLQMRQPQYKNSSVQRRNLLSENRRNMQSQNHFVRPAQRQLPQRVAPVQQQPAQPQMPSSWAAMSEQLLQLVFLQQQQLQQIQSAILKDQPMGGVGGAIAQKMGPDNTILMPELLAQAPQPPKKWTGNNGGYRKNWSGNKFLDNQGHRTGDEY